MSNSPDLAAPHLDGARLHAVIEQSPAATAILEGRQHRFMAASEAYRRIVGGREILGLPFGAAIPELIDQGFLGLLDRVFATGEPQRGTGVRAAWDVDGDGRMEERWVDYEYHPLVDPAGAVWGISILVTDVTERHLAEAALRASEEGFRAMFEAAAIGVAVVDLNGALVRVNPAFARMLGYTPEEVRSRTIPELTHPDEADRDTSLAAELLAGERDSYQVEKRYLHREGAVVWGRVTASLVRGPEGAPLYALKMVEDVTGRRRHEHERDFLARASEVLASSLDYEATLGSVTRLAVQELADWCAVDEGAPGGGIHRIAVAHPDPAMVEFAARMYEKYPMDPDAPSGIGWVLRTGEPELVPFIPDEVLVESAVDAEHLRMIRKLDVASYICVPLIARDRVLGALTLVSGRAGRRFGEHDLWLAEELARRAAVAIDNARLYSESEEARLRLEEQATEMEAQAEELQVQALQLEEAQLELEMSNDELRRAHDETAERAAEAERARAAAEEANLAKSQFLATMSHELRTPLNAIGGYVELMDMEIHGPVTDAQRDSLGRIRRGQQRLLGLINDVLNFARIEAGQVQYRFENVVLDETLQGMRALVEPLITGKDLHYEHLPGRPVLVRADRERLEQIVLNLLSNAVKFTSPGGRIEVGWDVAGAYADVRVRDTGRGIPAEDLEAIFEPFVQVDPSLTRESQGTGLGLAISRDLARAMGGEITARSTPGEGSTFTLRLPLAEESPAPR